MVSNDKVPFEIIQRSQNLNTISKQINYLLIIGIILFFSISTPSLINTFEKIKLNTSVYTLRKDFTERMLNFIDVVDSIAVDENIGLSEISVLLKKNERTIYSHSHNLSSPNYSYLQIFLYPDESGYGYNQYLEIKCAKCKKETISKLDSLLTIEYEKELRYTIQDVSRQFYNYNTVSKADFNISGINIKSTILPIILLIISLLVFHFSKVFANENEEFQKASRKYLKKGGKSKKRIVESLKPSIIADSFQEYYLYPFSNKVIALLIIIYAFICIFGPIHVRVIDYKGPSIIYLYGMALKIFFEAIMIISSFYILRRAINKTKNTNI